MCMIDNLHYDYHHLFCPQIIWKMQTVSACNFPNKLMAINEQVKSRRVKSPSASAQVMSTSYLILWAACCTACSMQHVVLAVVCKKFANKM